MDKYVLIIRTERGAISTAKKVVEMGLTPIILPAAKIIPSNIKPDFSNIQALLVTSSNTLSNVSINDEALSIPIYAVGDATAASCQDKGFKNVISAGGDANALAMLIADRLKPQNGALMHLRGHDVAGDARGLLEACGFEVISHIVYETEDNIEFKEQLSDILKQKSGFVLFHSPKGAMRFANVAKYNDVANWAAIAISQAAINDVKEGFIWKKIMIAQKPNEASMLSLLEP